MSLYKIYGSSAGSGKTFTLTKTYLGLLLSSENPLYFKQILAITFTNDAAAEMKERILSTLKEIGGKEEDLSSKSQAILESLHDELGDLSKETIKTRAQRAFNLILQDYADFHVKTIDSFVNQLANTFSLDLGLPFNYEVVLDKEPLLLKATERVFDKIGHPEFEFLSDLIESFAVEQADEGKNWQMLLPNLAQFAKNLFNDQFYNLIQSNEGLSHSDYSKIKKNIQAYLKITQNQFLALGKEGNEILERHDLTLYDFSNGKSGFGSIFIHFNNPNSDALHKDWVPGKRMRDAIEDDKWYAKAATEDVKSKIEIGKEEIRAWYLKSIQFLESVKPKFLLLKEVRNNLSNLALLEEVKKEFGNILSENNQAYITDFNRRVNKVIAAEPVSYIYERLGEKYNHLLIDEFQDTSDLQYYNLLPLIENSLSKNLFNMLVGDPKQSIYRWRGGKVELMIHLMNNQTEELKKNQLLTEHQKYSIDSTALHLQKENLDKNYRSQKQIIAFNNSLFSSIIENSEEEIIKQAFQDKTQLTHEGSQDGGHVEILLTEDPLKESKEEKVNELDWTLSQLIIKIKDAKSEGYALGDMAILCRKKKGEATEIADYLLNNGIDVISADSLLLKNNLGITFLLSLLNVYYEPSNKSNHANAILLFHRYHQIPLPNNIDFRQQALSCWEYFKIQNVQIEQKVLSAFGLYQLVESFANKMGMFSDEKLLPFLFAFFDIIQNQVKTGGNSLSEFLQQWEQSSNSYSVNISKPDAITVSTIHKSKGLEYPVVFIPFANWSILPQVQSKFWFDLENISYPELQAENGKLNAAPVTSKKVLSLTEISDQYQKELDFSKLEALNILYVALTRPTDRLYILAKKPRSKENSIYNYLASFVENIAYDGDKTKSYAFSKGNKKVETKGPIKGKSIYTLTKLNSRENIGKLKIKSNQDRQFNEQTQRDTGNLIHTLFAYIKTISDLDFALQKIIHEGLIQESEKEDFRKGAIKVMEHPLLSPLFSGEITVENERDILQKDCEASRPDRVVFQNNRVSIIDYKTGIKKDSHLRQIKHYGELYRQMDYDQIDLLLVYLSPLEVIMV